MQSTNNANGRFMYQYPHTTLTTPIAASSSSASLHDLHQQNQYYGHRPPDHGGFFSVHNKKRSIFMIVLLLMLLLLLLVRMIAVPSVWYSTLLSSSSMSLSSTTRKTMPAIMMGGDKNNDKAHGNNNRDSDGKKEKYNNDSVRSYQDLANTIRSLRTRREVSKDETTGEWEDRDGKIDSNKGDRDDPTKNVITNEHNNGIDDEEDMRLKRLEQKIRRDQNEKVRQEFLLSHKMNNARETRGVGENVGTNSEHQQKNGHQQHLEHKDEIAASADTTALKYKVMSENIAALKRFNDKNIKTD